MKRGQKLGLILCLALVCGLIAILFSNKQPASNNAQKLQEKRDFALAAFKVELRKLMQGKSTRYVVGQLAQDLVTAQLQLSRGPSSQEEQQAQQAVTKIVQEEGFIVRGKIGLLLDRDNSTGLLLVTGVVTNFPADTVGIRPGDLITHVDGKSVAGMSFEEAVRRIREFRWTDLQLTIDRSGETNRIVAVIPSIH